MRRSFLVAEKVATVSQVAALTLAWFLGLDIAGVDPQLSLLAWSTVLPLLLYPLLGRLARSAARHTEDVTCPARTRSVLNYVRGQVDPSVRVILDCCNRLEARGPQPPEPWRVVQEAATIHSEAIRLREALSRALQDGGGGLYRSGEDLGPTPRQDRRAIVGYVRRASGVANLSGSS